MQRSKIKSYLGFARRAGKLTMGVNAASTVKRCCLLVADENVGPNSRKEIEKMKKKFGCPLLYLSDLGELVGKPCMLVAVREEHLAAAIVGESGEEEEGN